MCLCACVYIAYYILHGMPRGPSHVRLTREVSAPHQSHACAPLPHRHAASQRVFKLTSADPKRGLTWTSRYQGFLLLLSWEAKESDLTPPRRARRSGPCADNFGCYRALPCFEASDFNCKPRVLAIKITKHYQISSFTARCRPDI